MQTVSSLQGQRGLIWTIVAVVVILGGVATYICYISQKDATDLPVVNRSNHFSNHQAGASLASSASSTQSSMNGWKTYINSSLGYSFQYPESYSFSDDTDHLSQYVYNDSTTTSMSRTASIEIDVHPDQSEDFGQDNFGTTGSSFLQNTDQLMENFCRADGPGSSESLTSVYQQNKFTNQNGLTYWKIYFKEALDGVKFLGIVGPMYVFDISSPTQNHERAIIVYDLYGSCQLQSSSTSTPAVLNNLVQSLKV